MAGNKTNPKAEETTLSQSGADFETGALEAKLVPQKQPLTATEILQREKAAFQLLLDEVRKGSEDAAWTLVQQYGPHIRTVVRDKMNPRYRNLYDSDDLVQCVWASFVRIQDRLGELDSPQRFVGLLAKMARNKVVDAVRKEERRVPETTGAVSGDAKSRSEIIRQATDRTPTPSQFLVAKEHWTKMVEGKSENVRKVLELRLQGLTFREIATELSITERSARRYVNELLEQWLSREFNSETPEASAPNVANSKRHDKKATIRKPDKKAG
jgi:RNA polymerase sigma factor (sigma-70 family)